VVNALKHSGASKILVWLSGEGHTLRLRVTDNGRGFDTQNVFAFFDGHFGVVGMRERAQRLHGEFLLESDPATGTTVEVKVPLR
jgi:signal transduction histidine kinase